MSEDSGHPSSSFQESFGGHSRHGSTAGLIDSAMNPGGPRNNGITNPGMGDYPDGPGSSYNHVSETYPVLDIDRPPEVPPMRRSSSSMGLQPGSTVIYQNEPPRPPRPPKLGQQQPGTWQPGQVGHVDHMPPAGYNGHPPLRRTSSNQEMGYHQSVHAVDNRGQIIGWNGQGYGQGMMDVVPDQVRRPDYGHSYHGPLASPQQFRRYRHPQDMMF